MGDRNWKEQYEAHRLAYVAYDLRAADVDNWAPRLLRRDRQPGDVERRILRALSAEVQADRYFFLELLNQSKYYGIKYYGGSNVLDPAELLGCTSQNMRNDMDIVLEALRAWRPKSKTGRGSLLQYVSPELRDDRDIVLAAVAKSGAVLEYASPNLRSDREVVLAAVLESGRALKHASSELQKDRELVLAAASPSQSELFYRSG